MRQATLLLLAAWALAACGGGGPKKAKEFQDPTKALDSVKPDADKAEGLADSASPKLLAYLQRVLKDDAIELVQARPFAEGHINETWYLSYERQGVLEAAVLKIFADDKAAKANAAQFKRADERRWPVPDQLARGTAAPYSKRPALLMEFVAGGTLQSRLEQMFAKGHVPFPDEVAEKYGDVARAIGILHREQRRPRAPGDRSGKKAMAKMIADCAKAGWCGAEAQARFKKLADVIDTGPVSFIHGDLYESQVVLKPQGSMRGHIEVAAFLDLDESGMGDPAVDVGSLLAHVLLIHPRTRWKSWGIPDPSADETRAVAEKILEEYREGARIGDDAWPGFIERARGWMWLRLNNVMVKYRKSEHAAELLAALEKLGPKLTESDPLQALLQ